MKLGKWRENCISLLQVKFFAAKADKRLCSALLYASHDDPAIDFDILFDAPPTEKSERVLPRNTLVDRISLYADDAANPGTWLWEQSRQEKDGLG